MVRARRRSNAPTVYVAAAEAKVISSSSIAIATKLPSFHSFHFISDAKGLVGGTHS